MGIVARTIILLLCIAPVNAEVRHCPAGLADVTAPSDASVANVCRAVADVSDRLAACGIVPRHSLTVHVVQRLPEECPEHALAYFDARTQTVTVPTYAECVRLASPNGRWGVPMTPALYQSLIVHELTHAVISQNIGRVMLGRAAHEYLAYAFQFDLMEPGLRRRILARYPHAGPLQLAELSETYFDLSPERFAVKAYRHFTEQDSDCRFVLEVMQGAQKFPSGAR